jgi:hypothetical protein
MPVGAHLRMCTNGHAMLEKEGPTAAVSCLRSSNHLYIMDLKDGWYDV